MYFIYRTIQPGHCHFFFIHVLPKNPYSNQATQKKYLPNYLSLLVLSFYIKIGQPIPTATNNRAVCSERNVSVLVMFVYTTVLSFSPIVLFVMVSHHHNTVNSLPDQSQF